MAHSYTTNYTNVTDNNNTIYVCICMYMYVYVCICMYMYIWIYHRFLAEDLCVVQWQACHYVVSYEAAFYFIRHDLARQPAAFYLL